MENITLLVVGMVVGLAAVNWVYFKIFRIAIDKNLVDNPDARKLQKRPVPVMGGVAVFFGIFAGQLTALAVEAIMGGHTMLRLMPVLSSLSLMLYVGALDDISGLTPSSRLAIEVLTVLGVVFATGLCVDTFRGMWGIGEFSWWLGVPLTVFAGVGIINAMNMIDGVNGLSSGLCMTCSCLFGVVFLKSGDMPNAILAFISVAVLIPFFLHNVFGLHSRMFIGDAGTMVMGMLQTWFVICMLGSGSAVSYFTKANGVNAVALATAVLSVPVFDTLRVMTMRMLHGVSPFRPDKTHLHHVFVNIGISHFVTAMCEIGLAVAVVAIWALSVCLGAGLEMQMYIVVAASVLLVWGTYAFLRYHVRRHTHFLHWLVAKGVITHMGRTEWWRRITDLLDAPCIDMVKDVSRMDEPSCGSARHTEWVPRMERDRKCILDFMKGRAEVVVTDLIANSGADPFNVYPVLLEEIRSGNVVVLKETESGKPEFVALAHQ